MSDLWAEALRVGRARLRAGVGEAALGRLSAKYGIQLPADHQQLLARSNGFSAFGGFERLFGVFSGDELDAGDWNAADCWKFAWGGLADAFWCFAGNAWGDQYAYHVPALQGSGRSDVYRLDAISMTPT